MRQGRYLKQLNTSGNIRTSFWQRQFSDDERVKVNLKKISIQRRSQEKGRERDMGVTIKYRGVIIKAEKQLNTYIYLIRTKMVKILNEHPAATFKFNVGTRQSEFQKQS